MFYASLIKKVAIPDNKRVRCLSWNPEHGWLAAGGEDAMLRVFTLEAEVNEAATNVRGVAASTKLGMNQPLEGHKCAWRCASLAPLCQVLRRRAACLPPSSLSLTPSLPPSLPPLSLPSCCGGEQLECAVQEAGHL
jgi:hypothetical protein